MIPVVTTLFLLVGSVSVEYDRLRQKSWSLRSVSCVAARKNCQTSVLALMLTRTPKQNKKKTKQKTTKLGFVALCKQEVCINFNLSPFLSPLCHCLVFCISLSLFLSLSRSLSLSLSLSLSHPVSLSHSLSPVTRVYDKHKQLTMLTSRSLSLVVHTN